MLKFLLLEQKLDSVLLFLQGMREDDVTAFLGLRIRSVWEEAAKFGFKSGTEEEVSAPTRLTGMDGKKVIVDSKVAGAMQGEKDRRTSQLAQFANQPAAMSRMATTISHVSQMSTDDFWDVQAQLKKREDDARAMLSKIIAFDESDIGLPPYSKSTWVADIADNHLTAWVDKKWLQKQQGFEMSPATIELICGRSKTKPRDLTIDQLTMHQQNLWEQKAEWFLKLLTHAGYIISQHSGSQLDEQGGIERIHDSDLLVDAIAQTRHNLWLRKKLEDRWAYGPTYDSENKISPYIKLFTDLSMDDQNFIGKYAKKQVRMLLAEGYWIWRPDMLERLYYDAATDPTTSGHVLRLFQNGMFWRSNVLNVIAKLMGKCQRPAIHFVFFFCFWSNSRTLVATLCSRAVTHSDDVIIMTGPTYIHDFSTFSALDPYFHLLVWAIICQRFDLVECFWKKRKVDCIANGLVAATLAKNICNDVDLSPEIKSVYVDQALIFKARTLGVFKACVNRDSTQTEKVLLGRYPTAGWLTLWELAFGLEKEDEEDEDEKEEVNGVVITSDAFTAQDLFVEIVSREWFGLVSPDNGLMKILLFLPFFFMNMFHVDDELAPGSQNKTWMQAYVRQYR